MRSRDPQIRDAADRAIFTLAEALEVPIELILHEPHLIRGEN